MVRSRSSRSPTLPPHAHSVLDLGLGPRLDRHGELDRVRILLHELVALLDHLEVAAHRFLDHDGDVGLLAIPKGDLGRALTFAVRDAAVLRDATFGGQVERRAHLERELFVDGRVMELILAGEEQTPRLVLLVEAYAARGQGNPEPARLV